MSDIRRISFAHCLLAFFLSGATAAEGNHFTVGVGLDHILTVEGGLAIDSGTGDFEQYIDIEVADDKVADAIVMTPRLLLVGGRRPGKATVSFATLDGKRHRYQIEVVEPTQEMLEPAGTERMDLGVGQARFLMSPMAAWVRKQRDGPWCINTSDPRVLDYYVLSSSHVIVVGEGVGYSNLTFISPRDEVTRFCFRVSKSRHCAPGEQEPEKLPLVVGKPSTLKLPQAFHGNEDMARCVLTRPALVDIEGLATTNSDIAQHSSLLRLKKARMLTLLPKQIGDTDLVLHVFRNQPDSTEPQKCADNSALTVHYQITVEDPHRDEKK